MYYIYALYNQEADKIYIGQTADINKRLVEHNNQNKHFTGKIQGKWVLIYKESAATRSEALKREKQLKSYRGRVFIKNHIPE
jgi:putative endonuclease